MMIRERRQRNEFFPENLFADPAWDMLLELYQASLDQCRMSVTNLCEGAAVPPTTALRWIGTLEANGLATRRSDPLDGRRVFIALSETGMDAMDAYFCSCVRR
jgi:DNA-binding MarR family transcriptional regulator